MDDDEGARPRADGRRRRIEVDQAVVGDVDEDRPGAGVVDGRGRGRERERRDEDLIAGADARDAEGEFHRRGARRDGERAGRTLVPGEGLLESVVSQG